MLIKSAVLAGGRSSKIMKSCRNLSAPCSRSLYVQFFWACSHVIWQDTHSGIYFRLPGRKIGKIYLTSPSTILYRSPSLCHHCRGARSDPEAPTLITK